MLEALPMGEALVRFAVGYLSAIPSCVSHSLEPEAS
jgi:hypothetical protein